MTAPLLVAIVDDDQSVRESLPSILREHGYAVQTFSSAERFLASGVIAQASCLLLDIVMPGMSGPELQRELVRSGYQIPIIFITGQSAEDVRARGLEHGAFECLFKPLNDTAVLDALARLFERTDWQPGKST